MPDPSPGLPPQQKAPSRSNSQQDGNAGASKENLQPSCEADQPLVIEADAPLVDGLRALLVHHLKKSIGSHVVNLSVSQAELLEHHLARLTSYAQKIVHTLAFATRFLARQGSEATNPDPLPAPSAPPAGVARGPASERQRGPVPRIPMHPPQPEPRTSRKPLKLRDDEILDLYRSAQAEAAIEADWRGIQGPTPSRGGESTDGGFTGRTGSSVCSRSGDVWTPDTDSTDAKSNNQEYLRILSRALQQPGRSPRALAAELLDPGDDSEQAACPVTSQELVCCDPRMDTVIDGVLGTRSRHHNATPVAPANAGAMSALSGQRPQDGPLRQDSNGGLRAVV